MYAMMAVKMEVDCNSWDQAECPVLMSSVLIVEDYWFTGKKA
jgi:hypothetical protein